MAKAGPEQMRFGIRDGKTDKARLKLGKVPAKPTEPEGPHWLPGLVSSTDVTRSFFEGQDKTPDFITGSLMLGNFVDELAMIGNLINSERAWYCAPKEENPKKSVGKILPGSLPTALNFHDVRRLLEDFRPLFQKSEEGHRPYEREEIKRKLHEVWPEIARRLDIRSFFYQSTMINQNGILLPSGRTASPEEVSDIAARIIDKRFDTLVENDPDYNAIFQPAFVFEMTIGERKRHLYVRPDRIEVLKPGQKTTQEKVRKGQIVKRIMVTDIKNSRKELFEDPKSPIARTIRFTRMVDEQIARKFDWNLLIDNARTQGWSVRSQRVFLITSQTPDSFPPDQTETKYICLDEEGEDVEVPMPQLTKEEKKLAIQDLRDYFAKAA